jgi:HK97 family phage major capsid protein
MTEIARRIAAHDRREDAPLHGFESFGDFALAVRAARSRAAVGIDERLKIGAAAPTTFGSEGTGQDGGFAVPTLFARQMFIAAARQEENLLQYCDTTLIDGNSLIIPTDETTPWATGGVRAYWQNEAVTTATKPLLRDLQLRQNKLIGLVPVSDELLHDAAALSSYLPAKLGLSIVWKTNEGILNGLGGGSPLGCFKSPAAIVVAKDAGQATATISQTNLTNMVARLPPGSFGPSCWLIAPDAIPALLAVNLASYPMVPAPPRPDGRPSSLIGLLYGRPAIASQHVAAFSSQGDISLVDLQYYAAIVRSDGPRTSISLDFAFDAGVATFKVVLRVDGVPKIVSQIAQANSSNKLSPFIQLAAR